MTTKLLVPLIFFALTFTAGADELEIKYLQNIQCRDQVFAQLAAMKATREWTRTLPGRDGSQNLMSPTDITGVWVTARVFLNGEVELQRLTPDFVQRRTVDLKTCRYSHISERRREVPAARHKNRFTDRDLRALLASGRRQGLIYIWSPNMPYSFAPSIHGGADSGITRTRAVAAKLGLDLTVLLDGSADERTAAERVKRYGGYMNDGQLRAVASLDLIYRAAGHHYPVLFVYAGGKLGRTGYPGLGTETEYETYAKQQLEALRGSK